MLKRMVLTGLLEFMAFGLLTGAVATWGIGDRAASAIDSEAVRPDP